MRTHIAAANRETGPMLEEANTLLTQKQQIESKQQLLKAFNAHFIISETDLAILTSTAEPVNEDFFRVLTRVKKINQDCELLLGSQNQRLGLEILDQSSKHLNAAFQKLYRWVQREFKTLDLENPQISAAIRRALRVLAERPTLFQNCLDFFAESRERTLSDAFYSALTGSSSDSDRPAMGKAIELSAHDPLRYVGDMLAWTHATTVSEREALEVLFVSEGNEIAKNIQAGIESEPWARSEDTEELSIFDGKKALNSLVDQNLADVFRQLRQRVEQVIQSHEDATLAYKISNLIVFYCSIFTSLLGKESSLLDSLRPLSDSALRHFKTTMRDHVANLRADLSIAPSELSAPDFLVEALDTLQVLMKSYETSVGTVDRAQRAAGFQPILEEALDPFLAGCENITTRLEAPNDHIFALNCLLTTKATLKQYPFTDRLDDLQDKIKDHSKRLSESMHSWFLHESGLQQLVNSVAAPEDLASSYADSDSLEAVAQQLDAFLPTATDDARTVLRQLEDKTLVRRVTEVAAESFCEDFEDMERMILQADEARASTANGGVDEEELMLRDVFPRTGDEIRVLLS